VSYIYLKTKKKVKAPKTIKTYLIPILVTSGVLLLSFAFFPILKFQIEYSIKLKQVLNPLSIRSYNRGTNLLGDMTTDYTQLSNWFADDSGSRSLPSDQQVTYFISIPKLNIKDASVTVGSMDLKKSLIQYPQTALPGQLGNTVIFGHSVLPQFFNPKTYTTIFSTLYKLKQGDQIIVKHDNSEYKYIVEEMFEVQPTDLSVLEQRFDNRSLSLITCSPPGTYLRRLVVRAQLAL